MKRTTKKDVIKKHQKHDKDTGSHAVQVAILTEKINLLTEHLKEHKKDQASRKGLLNMVGKRRKLLNYLKTHNTEGYKLLVDVLKLRQ